MGALRLFAFKAALDALYLTGAQRWLAPLARGSGVIFMLHHVRPWQDRGFSPNRHLEITPQFLDAVIQRVKERGFDLVSMDEAAARIRSGRSAAPFAAFTLDDGYRDNAEHAAPVFRRHRCPYTVFVTSDFAEGRGVLWWEALEEAVRRLDHVEFDDNGVRRRYETDRKPGKIAAYSSIYHHLFTACDASRTRIVRDLAAQAGFDVEAMCRDLCLSWEEIRTLLEDPLAGVGAHTRTHPILSRMSRRDARADIADGRTEIREKLGRRVRHFAYPVGNRAAAGAREFAMVRDLGFLTGITTRRGLIHPWHAADMSHLPRVSLNGYYQSLRYIDMFLSGVPFAISNRLRPADAT